MPKLAKKIQKSVDKSEAVHGSGGFDLIPPGKYIATLTAVGEGEDNFGNDRWEAEFSDITSITDGKTYPGRQWLNLQIPQDPTEVPSDYEPRDPKKGSKKEQWAALQESNAGRIRAFFESLGYSTDTDTDEMVDDAAKAIINIGQGTIQNGSRKGQKFNRIYGIEEVPEDLDLDALASDDDDDF